MPDVISLSLIVVACYSPLLPESFRKLLKGFVSKQVCLCLDVPGDLYIAKWANDSFALLVRKL